MTYRLIATYEPANEQTDSSVSSQLKAWFSSPDLDGVAKTPGLTGFEIMGT